MSSRSFPKQPVSRPSSRSRNLVEEEEAQGRPARTVSPGLPSAVRRRPDAPRSASASAISSSSSGRSLLDRMKPSSSRTDSEDNTSDISRGTYSRGQSRLKAQNVRGGEDDEEAEPVAQAIESISGYGYDLWGRVSLVASKLTVNVNQAWQKSVHLADGEETPPGGESRLTKAMKAYHLQRARSPADLPAWLFEEHERGVGSRTWNVKREDSGRRSLPENQPEPTQRGGLRDVYERAANPPALSASKRGDGDSGSTRATDRLRAIRDAKRLAAQGGSKSDVSNKDYDGMNVREANVRTGPPRIGLPSGPGRAKSS